MGRPNVGKSTLVNTFLEHKIAAVSSRPQMTRKRQLGILSLPDGQIIFQDTPGVHKPRHKLGQYMNQQALETLEDTDVVLFITDATQPPTEDDASFADIIRNSALPIILVLNKIDLLPGSYPGHFSVSPHQALYQALLPDAICCPTSAVQRTSMEELLLAILSLLPEHPPYYPDDQLTDLYEREIACDLIREAVLNHLRDEVPHAVAVRLDEYTERGDSGAFIAATLFVERESQKAIIIGQGGEMLKKIGSASRREIERMNGRKIFLELRVKQQQNWRNDEKALQSLGYKKR